MSKEVSREKLRGKPLDKECYTALITTNEYGKNDNRKFCYGFMDSSTEEIIEKCFECGAYVGNAQPLKGGSND